MEKNNVKKVIRSPFFYVGDKYKLMNQLGELFPNNIDTYIEPFVGGGSSYLNNSANRYKLNDKDYYVVKLHEEISKYKNNPDDLLKKLYEIINFYGLSCSHKGITAPEELKKKYIKTYYAKYNKESYLKLRDDFNGNQDNILYLYILLIYGFNHMIRFNNSGKFNLPVGNVDFNKNVYNALNSYLYFARDNHIEYKNLDYKDFLKDLNISDKDFVFFDPPYLISASEYNKQWDDEKEKELYDCLDLLDRNSVKWGITNLVFHKGNKNTIFSNWAQKYYVYNIKSNYISFNDNTIKENSKEVYVTNYDKKSLS
nr:DNA adenine methylase [Sedimentibacter sp.]